MDIVKDLPVKTYFLPGENDWSGDGVDGLRRQAEFIEEYLGDDDAFQPSDDGCGKPEDIELTDQLGLLIIDSQWFLENWDKDAEINEECDIRTRRVFEEELVDDIRDYRGKNLLVVAHHPLFSGGFHGGHHSLKEHLFPMSLLGFFERVPVPVLGSVAIAVRSAVSTRQDLSHPLYQYYINIIEDAARSQGNLIYAAGHEKNLQLHIDKEIAHIVSGGGGAEATPSKLVHDGVMSYGGRGLAVLDFYENGEAWVEFIASDEGVSQVKIMDKKNATGDTSATNSEGGVGEEAIGFAGVVPETRPLASRVIYRQKLKDALPTTEELTPDVFPEYEKGLDSVEVSILQPGEIWDMNNFVWGKMWSEYYYKPVKMPVLDLEKYDGGLTAFKQGGGFQTKSIRLKTDQGPERLYQIRGIQKSADKLYYPLNKTFVKDILEYQYTAANPFAAFMLNPMQDAIGILHTNPQLFYVPKQPRLNRYNDLAEEVFLFEERPDEDWSDLESFAFSSEIVSTGDVIEERLESDDAVIDQALMARCRLFDWVIGDWDRHDDQWRFASTPIPGTDRVLYQPIPRDRDQAFARYEGLVFRIGRMFAPTLRATHPFDDKIRKHEVRWLGFNGKHFDRFFLNELDWAGWQKEVQHIQSTLTDEVIDEGVRWLPDDIYREMGPYLAHAVKSRRDNLAETAWIYYKFLNKEVSIPATQKENHILVERLGDGHTRVTVLEYDDDRTKTEKIYERVFDNKITKEIRVFGLEGDDDFEVRGSARRSPIVRLIGGIDEDRLIDRSQVDGLGRKTKFYDDRQEDNELVKNEEEVEDKRSNVTEENAFIFHHYNFDYAAYFPVLGFNPDDGVYVGLNTNIFTHGYRSERIHQLRGKFATATGGVQVGYSGLFTNALRRNDFSIEAELELPDYVDNFFGLGNESVRLEDMERNFYRVSRERFYFSPALTNTTDGGFKYTVGPLAEAVKIERRENTFLAGDDTGVRPEVFDYQYFAGAKLDFGYANVDNVWNPERGVDFQVKTSWRANLENQDRNFVNLDGALTLYLPLAVNRRFVFATKVAGRHNIGEFDFFQANTLGGDDNLRGFASERFSGRTVFYHNNELRWTILNRDNADCILSVGIAPAIDYGRVWSDGENSDKWHVGYGGNVFIAPLDYVAIKAGLMQSEEGSRFTFRLGFDF